MFEIFLHKSVDKKFGKLQPELKNRIYKAIDMLRYNPFLGKKLHGELEGSYRFRVGDFRIVYDIIKDKNLVIIHALGSRGDIYK